MILRYFSSAWRGSWQISPTVALMAAERPPPPGPLRRPTRSKAAASSPAPARGATVAAMAFGWQRAHRVATSSLIQAATNSLKRPLELLSAGTSSPHRRSSASKPPMESSRCSTLSVGFRGGCLRSSWPTVR